MIVRMSATLIGVSIVLGACSNSASFENATLDSDDQKASYGIGLNVGQQLVDASERLDRAAFMRGIEDALEGSDPDIDGAELQAVLQQFGQEIQEAAAADQARQAEDNLAEGQAFLEENAQRDGVVTTDSGLQYEMLSEGDGASPSGGEDVRLHYRGSLIDGTEFDSSYDGEPVVFSSAPGRLISGFTESLLLLAEGGHIRVWIPSDIGYGPNGSGGVIGPNQTLIFEIELFEVVE